MRHWLSSWPAGFTAVFRHRRLDEDEQTLSISGGVDLLSVAAAVAVAFALSHMPGLSAWPLTGLGTVITYLLVGGVGLLIARSAARHTSVGRPE